MFVQNWFCEDWPLKTFFSYPFLFNNLVFQGLSGWFGCPFLKKSFNNCTVRKTYEPAVPPAFMVIKLQTSFLLNMVQWIVENTARGFELLCSAFQKQSSALTLSFTSLAFLLMCVYEQIKTNWTHSVVHGWKSYGPLLEFPVPFLQCFSWPNTTGAAAGLLESLMLIVDKRSQETES